MWLRAIDPGFVDRRFGVDVVNTALASPRVYVEPPAIDGPRVVAVLSGSSDPARERLSTPYRTAIRVHDEVIDVSCTCRHGRVCEHAVWLLVDLAFAPELRAALAASPATEPIEPLVRELPRVRARALEERTFEQRLAAWLPPRTFDDDWEIDVEVRELPTPDGPRSAVLLRHRRPTSRALVAARTVLASRLRPNHRGLVELTAPFHLDKNVLVSTRGQATLLVKLLGRLIGLYADSFKHRARFAAVVSPRLEREGDRLVARWYTAEGALVADAADALVLAGPFPYLWAASAHTFHEIAASVDLDLAVGLQRIPSIAVEGEAAERIGRALLPRSRSLGVAVPPPETFGLPPLETPTFELQVIGSPLDLRAELFAVFSAGKFVVGGGGGEVADVDAEEAAIALVTSAGFVANTRDGATWFSAEEDEAVRFWHEVSRLRASTAPRFEIVLAEGLAATRVGPTIELDVRVTEDVGWLDTKLEFRAGALQVEIARLHRVLAQSRRWVVLSDGTLAKMTEQVAALVGDAAAVPSWADAFGGKIPPHQFGRIARWIELADGASVRVHVSPALEALRTRLRDLARAPAPNVPERLAATLRPYQVTGVAWLGLLRGLGAGGLLADDMGLGKTLMTLAFLAGWRDEEGEAPSLVVCPTSVVGNWLREAERFVPWLRVRAWHGSDRRDEAIEGYDLVVTTYGILRRDVELLATKPFRAVVLDEAQNVKNPASETARAARRLGARMRLALTGTPVENRLSELWSLMTFANPGILGTAGDFDERYERPISLRPDGAVAASLRAVVRPFILRRTKDEVLSDLPPKIEIERACVFGLVQKRLYDALALALRQTIAKNADRRDGARLQLSVLTAILRLRQMACDPRLVDPEASPADSAKLAHFLELVRELVSEGRRALVFSQFVELLALWRTALDEAKVAYEYLDGSTTNRDAVVDRFQRGTAPLFLISLKAGGSGLNLTAADTVIHCDPWWNPAVEDQATDRAHRIGQSRAVTVVRLVARGTIEDKVALLKRQKTDLAAAILSPPAPPDLAPPDEASLFAGLTDSDLAQLFAPVEGEADEETREGTTRSEDQKKNY